MKSAFISSASNSVEILSETAKKYGELGNINIPEEVVSTTLSPEATVEDISKAKQIIRDQYSSAFTLDFYAIENTDFILEEGQILAVAAKDPLFSAKN